MFHQHELVRIGEPEPVAAWRDEWAQRGLKLLCGLGLDARLSVATDPFFGRRGRLLAANQRDQALKLELLIDIVGDGPTACASFNQHRDHFAAIHGLVMHDGSPAHTACVGFGHERIVMALIRRHGSALDAWPQPVRRQLWADGDE
jgi:seryl-tRNA synthetase